ncbi:hypothetical protein ACQP1G_05890 [Nocardia sp. CA-107356]
MRGAPSIDGGAKLAEQHPQFGGGGRPGLLIHRPKLRLRVG